jgi:hypothetical protein
LLTDESTQRCSDEFCCEWRIFRSLLPEWLLFLKQRAGVSGFAVRFLAVDETP